MTKAENLRTFLYITSACTICFLIKTRKEYQHDHITHWDITSKECFISLVNYQNGILSNATSISYGKKWYWYLFTLIMLTCYSLCHLQLLAGTRSRQHQHGPWHSVGGIRWTSFSCCQIQFAQPNKEAYWLRCWSCDSPGRVKALTQTEPRVTQSPASLPPPPARPSAYVRTR